MATTYTRNEQRQFQPHFHSFSTLAQIVATRYNRAVALSMYKAKSQATA